MDGCPNLLIIRHSGYGGRWGNDSGAAVTSFIVAHCGGRGWNEDGDLGDLAGSVETRGCLQS